MTSAPDPSAVYFAYGRNLSAAGLAALDAKEGGGWAYERRAVRVIPDGAGGKRDGADGELEAFAYAVIARDGEHMPPAREYVEALLAGARERGLPEDYVAALDAIATGRR
jgi:hypothetical protein